MPRVSLLLPALVLAMASAHAESPWPSAAAAWHLGQSASLRSERGPVEQAVPLAGEEAAASRARGGDGLAAAFQGKGGLLGEASPLLPAEAMTWGVRVKPEKPGGLLQTAHFSLVLHESGLLVAIAGLAEGGGRLYREVPLAPLTLGAWHDVVARWERGTLELFIDGQAQARTPLAGPLVAVRSEPVRLGAYTLAPPAGSELPPRAVAWLYERLLTGAIDHAAIWTRALSDAEIAALSGVPALSPQAPLSDAGKCLEAWREFATASSARDVSRCADLGLTMRRFMSRDPLRPSYHLTAPMDAIFDPAGAIFYQGQYHVFSYRNLVSLLGCNPLVHYVSDDLVTWRDAPFAVSPNSLLDALGIWLANIFPDDTGTPTMLYTALGERGKIGVLARSRDGLVSFGEKEPVITSLVHHDGHTWKDGGLWQTITVRQHWGHRAGPRGDEIVLLTSPDLRQWTERGEIFGIPKMAAGRDDDQRHGFAEFPYLIPFGEKHALIVGTRPVRYWIGRYDPEKPAFIPDDPEGKLLDHLNPFHCFNPSIVDRQGLGGGERRIVLAMNRFVSGQVEGLPWYGVHVLPRVLTREGDRLSQEPVTEIERLRGQHHRALPQAGGPLHLHGLPRPALEIQATFRPGLARRLGIRLRAGDAETRLYIEPGAARFGAEGNLRKLSDFPELGSGPTYLQLTDPIRLRAFVDGSLLELFVNGQTLTGVLDRMSGPIAIETFTEGGADQAELLEAWEMKSPWR